MDDDITTEDIIGVPDTQETAPEPPKRRRGRPPRDPNAPPRPRGRPRKSKSLEDRIGGTLALINMAFAFAPESFRADALDDIEIASLAKAIDAAAQENPLMHKYLTAVLGGDGGAMANLIIVAAIIGGRRAIRHGIVADESWDERLGAFLMLQSGMVSGSAN